MKRSAEATPIEQEVSAGERFEFGKNWMRFVELVDAARVHSAEASLRQMLDLESLDGKTFLDVGCGSGLFSLAARRLGARVTSFDYDHASVSCARALRSKWQAGDDGWEIDEGSVLDVDFVGALGRFDVVYSWGVLHHTGDMVRAMVHTSDRVALGGILFIAIYNDQGPNSRRWLRVKQFYNRLPKGLRWLPVAASFIPTWGPTIVRDLLHGRPFKTWRDRSRGMSPMRDLIDWVGGLPFEVAKPEEIYDFFRSRGYDLERMKTCAGGKGCNEYVFRRLR